jgi:hypothetical protein
LLSSPTGTPAAVVRVVLPSIFRLSSAQLRE